MPPKKGAAKVAEPGSTIINTKGKEFEATAAAGRTRRSTVTEAPSKTAPVKKAASKAAAATASKSTTPANTGKKRGRPAKVDEDVAITEPPKKRGRPAKTASAAPGPAITSAKKAGRAIKAEAPAVTLDDEDAAPPKKRGRPPKGGETTQVAAEDEAAAEQLEEELVDAVDAPSKPISSVKKGKGGRGRPKKVTTEHEADEVDTEEEGSGTTDKQYWLMKAEQEDREETLEDGSVFNAKFTIDDLRAKGGPEPWDGVRNGAACKNMKAMKKGDLAFFYASGGKKGKVPGIVGIMEIVKEHEPDLGAFDPNNPYFVQNEKIRGTQEKPRWYLVHVEFRKKLITPVTLAALKSYAEKGSALSEMQELNAARLSVSKVSEKEWNFITNNLFEGYDDDYSQEAAAARAAAFDKTMLPIGKSLQGLSEPSVEIWPSAFDGTSDKANGTDVKQTIEPTDAITSETEELADPPVMISRKGSRGESAKPASRPASRAGSAKPASRTGSIKPASRAGSRAGSLAPPTTAVRGRSRTPRGVSAEPMAVLKEEVDSVVT